MKTVKLGAVATIERQGADPSVLPPETAYLGLEHIERGGRIIGQSTVGEAELASTKFAFTPQHVLFGKLRPNLAKISRPNFAGVCSTDILPIRPGPHLDRGYLAHFLSQPAMVEFAASRTSGANLPRLSPAVLATFPIPLPSLAEQRWIAAILDRADAIRTKRRQALAHLDSVTQSIFQDMFGEVTATRSLSSFVNDFRYGTSNKSGLSGLPTLRIPNVVGGGIDLSDVKTVAVTEGEASRLALRDGDLLFVRSNGNPDNVGRCAVFTTAALAGGGFDSKRWIFASYLIRARPLEPDAAPFLAAYLGTVEGRRALRERAKTSAGQYNVNIESIGSVPVPDVHHEHRARFIERLRKVDEQRDMILEQSFADDELFASLQSRAFRGEL